MPRQRSTSRHDKLDKRIVLQQASGRWTALIPALTGVDPALLDGRGHPCPICDEGVDRFSVAKDFAETGGVFCRQCFQGRSQGNGGNGFDTVMWLLGIDFRDALVAIANHVGTSTAAAGGATSPGTPPAGPDDREADLPPRAFKDADTAVRALSEQRGASPTTRYEYCDESGEPVGEALRWDGKDGKKTFSQIHRASDEWICKAMPKPRPLYRLPELHAAAPDEPVFLVEGEKAADALASVGLTVTTSPGGSSGYRQCDWNPLAGRDVSILPDADGPGAKYAAGVAKTLAALDPPATTRILDPAKLWDSDGDPPKGWDAADFVDARDAVEQDTLRARVLDAAAAAAAFDPAGVTQNRENGSNEAGFGDRPRRFEPFPLDVLPNPVRGYVGATAGVIGCEPAMIAGLLLAVLASAIGNSRRLRMNNAYSEPAIVWCAAVCESGQRKSPALDAALAEASRRQKSEWADWREEHARWKRAHAQWEVDFARWKKAGGGEPPDEPTEPALNSYLVDDVTIEALRDVLHLNPRGVLCASEELAGWFGMLDRYTGKKGADAAKWLAMHGGRSVRMDRRTGTPKTTYIPHASVSLCGTVQPGTLRRLLSEEHLESGLAARWLFVWPPRRRLVWREGDVSDAVRSRFAAVVRSLYELEMVPDGDGDPSPVLVGITSEAKRAYIGFFNSNGVDMEDARADEAASFSKLAAYALRFALIVHLIREAAGDPTLEHLAGRDGDFDHGEVDLASVEAGIAIAEWFKRESTRILAMLREEEEGDGARLELAEWIATNRGGSVTARDLAKARRRRYGGDSGKAEKDLRELSKAGYGRLVHRAPGPRGGRPTEDFILYKDDEEEACPKPKTPTSPPDQGVSGNAAASAAASSPADAGREEGEWSA